MLLDRNSLLKKDTLKVKRVDLEDDEFVYVREMTGREKDRFEQSLTKQIKNKEGVLTGVESNTEDFRAKLVVCTVCDENGNLLLEFKDYELLSRNMKASKLAAIAEAATEVNAISKKEQDELVKNSEGDLTASSTSSSVES